MKAIIDLDSICWIAGLGEKLVDSNFQPIKSDGKFTYRPRTENEVRLCIDGIMEDIITKTRCDEFIGFISGKNTNVFRRKFNSDYKSNRTGDKPSGYDTAYQYLITKYEAYKVDNMEVDDVVAEMFNLHKDSIIVAIDNDLLKLRNDDREYRNYNWSKSTFHLVSQAEADYKFWGDMICGQKGDGIVGLKGLGIAHWNKLVEQFAPYNTDFRTIIMDEYIRYYKSEHIGIMEFFKTYTSLKIAVPQGTDCSGYVFSKVPSMIPLVQMLDSSLIPNIF